LSTVRKSKQKLVPVASTPAEAFTKGKRAEGPAPECDQQAQGPTSWHLNTSTPSASAARAVSAARFSTLWHRGRLGEDVKARDEDSRRPRRGVGDDGEKLAEPGHPLFQGIPSRLREHVAGIEGRSQRCPLFPFEIKTNSSGVTITPGCRRRPFSPKR